MPAPKLDESKLPPGQRIDLVCDRFETAWSRGERPSIEPLLEDWQGQDRSELLRELVALEIELRSDAGDQAEPAEYHSRFPDATAVIDELFGETVKASASDETTAPVAGLPDIETDSSFGDYQLLEEIARGGMGVVYKAIQTRANRVVALKMILSGGMAGDEEVARFETEAKAAASLDHPYIVPVFEVGEHQGRHYYSMGFVEGNSLSYAIREQPLEPKRSVEIVIQLCEAVQYAHERNIVHRDLKPANVLLEKDGTPRITDFGLAKQVQTDRGQTATGQILGTPSYMPPEQALGKSSEIKAPADVYALGAILYHLLTGRPPFRAATILDTLKQVIEQDPVPPRQLNSALDVDLDTIVLKALEKQRDRRYDSAAALCDDLTRYLERRPISARRIGIVGKARRWALRNKLVASLLTLISVGCVGVIIGLLWAVITFRAMAATELTLRKESDAAKQETNANLYVAEMSLAGAATQSPNGMKRLRALVDKWEPSPGQPDLRAWEWFWLDAMSRREENIIQLVEEGQVAAVPTVDWNRAGDSIAWALGAQFGVINLETQEQLDFPLHDGMVLCLRFSHDGKQLATSSTDHSVRIWDVATQKLQAKISISEAIGAVCWSPDGQRMAFQTNFVNPATIFVVDLKSGETITELEDQVDGHLRDIGFSPDGKWLASAGFVPLLDHFVSVWDTDSWQRQVHQKIHTAEIYAVSWSPDSKRVATASLDGSIKVTTVPAGATTTIHQGVEAMQCVDWSPNGELLAAGGYEHSVRVWDAKTGQLEDMLAGHTHRINGLRWNDTDGRLATAGNDGSVRIWNQATAPLRTVHQLKTSEHHNDMIVHWQPDGRAFVAANNLPFTIWTKNTLVPSTNHAEPHSGIGYTQLGAEPSWSYDGELLASTYRGKITIWNGDATQEITSLTPPPHSALVGFSPTDKRLLLYGDKHDQSNPVWTWDWSQDNEPKKLADFERALKFAIWSPDSKAIAVNENDGTTVVDSQNGDQLHRFPAPAGYHITSIGWSPDGRFLASGANDQNVIIRNLANGEEITLKGHTAPVFCIAWHPNENRIATGSGDGTVRLWNTTTGQNMLSLPMPAAVKGLAWSPDGHTLLAGSEDATVRLWSDE